MHHLDEVPRAVRPAVQVALLGSTGARFATGGAGDVADARRERREERIEMLDDGRFTANHHAVAALEAPDAAARPHVHVVDALRGELLRAPDVVDVVRIAAVDQDVAVLEQRDEIVDARIHDPCRDHQPDGSRLAEAFDELGERRGSLRACRLRAPSPRWHCGRRQRRCG